MKIDLIKTRLGYVEYAIAGSGIPILFVHGGHSNCKDTLPHKGIDLEHYQLITPSRPGYGRTPLDGNKTPKQAAQLLAELINYLALEKVVVYGISAGGLTAIELASNFPDKVSKLILVSAVSKTWLDKTSSIYKVAKKAFSPPIEKFTWAMVRFFSSFFPAMVAKSFYSQFSAKAVYALRREDIMELAYTLKHYNSRTGFLNDIDQNIEEGVISRIRCPTLIMHSKNDNSVSLEHATYANSMIKSSTLEVLDNDWGHLPWLGKDSETSISKVNRFLEE